MRFLVALTLFLASPAFAQIAEDVRTPTPLAVKVAPSARSKTLFFTKPNEELTVLSEPEDGYIKVSVFRGGEIEVGYIKTEELYPQKAKPIKAKPYRMLGLAAYFTHLSQLGKSFVGSDQVKRKTSDSRSQSLSPYFVYQWGVQKSFWRVSAGLLQTHYTGTATKDVGTNLIEELEVSHEMFALGFERAWDLFGSNTLYYGFGAQIAVAQKMRIVLGGAEVGTTPQDLPLYFGANGLIGAQWALTPRLFSFSELRLGSYVSQSTPVLWGDLGVALMYAF